MAKKPAPKPVRKPAPKAPALRRPSANPLDVVRNPNFGAAMAQQDYFNNLSRLVAERNARGPEYNLMPIGEFSPEQIQNLSPDRRQALEQRMGVQQNPSIGQMQDYNRMLQQGIQNSNNMNQGAMANFANMQPGMQAQMPILPAANLPTKAQMPAPPMYSIPTKSQMPQPPAFSFPKKSSSPKPPAYNPPTGPRPISSRPRGIG